MTLALLFPGQGGQVVGMGRALVEAYPEAAAVLAEADEVLGFSLSGLMADGPESELTETRNTQPAILAHSVAALRVVRDRLGSVTLAAGHSLGEFGAHVAAGTISFREALEAVRLSGAFHSPLLEPAAAGLAEELSRVDFRDPDFPVVSNVTARPVSSGAEARELLVAQLTAPVRWAASVGAMLEAGVEGFVELGLGSVPCGLNKRNAKGSPCTSLGEPPDIEAWA